MLHVWNPKGGWWGEGDEKFFVDGETFPSTIGTGSEDYFGYAWCHPGLFQFAYHCQTMTENNRGHQSVLRWHVTDNIPFQKSFEACIEKYYPNSVGTLYACLPCYYLQAWPSPPIRSPRGTIQQRRRRSSPSSNRSPNPARRTSCRTSRTACRSTAAGVSLSPPSGRGCRSPSQSSLPLVNSPAMFVSMILLTSL